MAGKSFKNNIEPMNPALQFISLPEPEPVPLENVNVENVKKPPEGFKVNNKYVETKNRRVQLLLQPSLHEKLKVQAEEKGVSVNELVHGILKRVVR